MFRCVGITCPRVQKRTFSGYADQPVSKPARRSTIAGQTSAVASPRTAECWKSGSGRSLKGIRPEIHPRRSARSPRPARRRTPSSRSAFLTSHDPRRFRYSSMLERFLKIMVVQSALLLVRKNGWSRCRVFLGLALASLTELVANGVPPFGMFLLAVCPKGLGR